MPSPSTQVLAEVQHAIHQVNPVENTSNFCFEIRLECKDGVKKCVRIPFRAGLDTIETIKNAILERYLPDDLPDDTQSFNAVDHVVKLREICGSDWLIDIENTDDLKLAINTPSAKTNGFIKMSAFIRCKSDPPIVMLDLDSASNPSAMATTAESEALSPASVEKRKKVVSHQKKLPIAKRRKASKSVATTSAGGSKLPVRTRIIGALAELRALGKVNPPRIEVAIFAGYSNVTSKGFANALGKLKTEGIVTYPDKGSVSLTGEGLDTAEAKGVSPPTDNAEVHARIKVFLNPKQQQIFDLLAADGGPHVRDGAAAAVGYSNPTSKGWANSIGRMSSLGIVHYPKDNNTDPKRKLIQLTDMCFPFSKQQIIDRFASFHAATPPPLFSMSSNDMAAAGAGNSNVAV